MRFLKSLSAAAAFFVQLSRASSSGSSTLTVYAWPLSAQSPEPLAQIQLSPSAPSTSSLAPVSASLLSYNAPSIALSDSELVRIGLYNPSTKAWIGSGVSALSFAPGFDRKILLHTDESGEVFHVGCSATAVQEMDEAAAEKGTKGKKKTSQIIKEAEGHTTVEIVLSSPAPQPALNTPVVLNPDGKMEDTNEDNRSFLQK
jgi:hypothetical protein